MRWFVAVGLLLGIWAPAGAGLYNTSEPEEGKLAPDQFLSFRDTLYRLRSLAMPKVEADNPMRMRYVVTSTLASRANTGKLTPQEKLNLSEVLIRTRKVEDAVNLLVPLARQEPKNFLIQSNLATAYQHLGQMRRAIDTLEQALSVWPANLNDVEPALRRVLLPIAAHDGSYNLYRKAETYQLKLLKLRDREALTSKGAAFTTVDALFDDGKGPVKFVGESGKFEPGKLAQAEKAKLPKDAIDIVQQLLVWLPDDVRLYWLLGELYNAQGGPKNIKAARMIFNELAGFGGLGIRTEELAEHRRVLLSLPDEEEAAPFEIFNKLDEAEKKKDQPAQIDWQTLGVGFAIGLLVAVFGMWQIREIRRRRHSLALIK